MQVLSWRPTYIISNYVTGILFFFSENKKKKDLVEMMVRRGYDSDPVKAWKDAQNKGKVRTCTGQYSSS